MPSTNQSPATTNPSTPPAHPLPSPHLTPPRIQSPESPLPSSPPEATIHFDVACTACAYNLRGTNPTSLCPECGQPILRSFEEYARRGAHRLADSRSLAHRPPDFARSLYRASAYAILSHLFSLAIAVAPESFAERYTNTRTALLVLLCCSMACSALALWKYAHPVKARRGLIALAFRLTAAAYIVFILAVTISGDTLTFGYHYSPIFAWIATIAAALAALGSALLPAYTSWYLRLEGKSFVAWPALIASIPAPLTFAVLAFYVPRIGFGSYWTFNSFNVLSSFPTPTSAYPGVTSELLHQAFSSRYPEPILFAALAIVLLGQLAILLAHLRLLLLTRARLHSPTPPPNAPLPNAP